MICLITGGTGFVGSHVARELVERGHKVICFDLAPGSALLDKTLGPRAAEVSVVQGDLTLPHSLLHAIADHGVTHIVHLAALLAVACDENPSAAVSVNVGGMVNVLEACRLTGIRRLVWASSASALGGRWQEGEVIPNDAPQAPQNVYGATKSFSERLAEHYFKTFGIDSVGLRFGMMLGTSKPGGGVSSRLTRELLEKPARGEPSEVPWTDDAVDWLWVGDGARAVASALTGQATRSRAFNIRGDYRSIGDAARYVQHLLPDSRLKLLPGKFGFANPVDGSAIREELGFIPAWSMEQQVRQLINQVRGREGLPEV